MPQRCDAGRASAVPCAWQRLLVTAPPSPEQSCLSRASAVPQPCLSRVVRLATPLGHTAPHPLNRSLAFSSCASVRALVCMRARVWRARAFVCVCARVAFADSLSAAFSSRSRRACRPPPPPHAPHTPPVPPVPRSSPPRFHSARPARHKSPAQPSPSGPAPRRRNPGPRGGPRPRETIRGRRPGSESDGLRQRADPPGSPVATHGPPPRALHTAAGTHTAHGRLARRTMKRYGHEKRLKTCV